MAQKIRIRLPLTVFLTNLIILPLLRVAFFAAFRHTAGPLDPGEIARARSLFTQHYSPSEKTARALFFDVASREPYFKNTVFVLYGDHGTRTGAPGTDLVLGGLSPVVYHVPMLMYAPGFVPQGRRIDVP